MKKLMLVLLLLFAPGAVYAQDEAVPTWQIDSDKSTLTFEAVQMGAPFAGNFGAFGGEIAFDPGRLDESHARITVDMASVDANSKDRNKYIVQDAWLATESFPESVFATTEFDKIDENQYVAYANLTIRDVTLPVELPFTLEFSTNEDGQRTAKMDGELTLQRLDYGVGRGEWEDTAMVGNPVTVKVSLHATQQDGAPEHDDTP